MARTRTRLTAGATTLAVTLILSACAADGEPAAQPSSAAPSPSPTASPSPSIPTVPKPERPATMDDDGQAGAEAAALYFLSLEPYMQSSGDTSDWESMSHSVCEFCANRLEQAKEIAANGDTFTGGHALAEITETYAQDPPTGIWPIDVIVHQDATRIARPSGEVVFTQEANTFSARIEVALRDGEWVVVELANATPL